MTFTETLRLLQRFLAFDDEAVIEIRDDRRLTLSALVGALAAVLASAVGAWLYGEWTLNFTPEDWFSDTVFFGTIFTLSLFLAEMALIYALLTQIFREKIEPEALIRVLATAHIPYALGFLVFIDELGFMFGVMSVTLMFIYAFYALRVSMPASPAYAILFSVIAGFAIWLSVIPILSDLDNAYVTGVFVYGLIA